MTRGSTKKTSRGSPCYGSKWVWRKDNQDRLHRFWSMFPLTRVPFWYRFVEPQPNGVRPFEGP